MAIRTAQTTLGIAAVEITDFDNDPTGEATGFFANTLTVRATADIFIGGPDVTTGEGFLVKSGEVVSLDLFRAERVWAVVATGTPTAYVIRTAV